ncbi:hypothetical protein [Lysinibacillus odysseyi]|uniref:Uncharacterized protein n=1 Tax=Lysinibacillus odysseyi 34hs-1 = NBRC 100172 TaxID=1220589 RepID=A0A0A3IY67_9BACI|nr:hypothetical protein [Lysinibacillus odysseyi]KGR88385.1 hypothetical protein CD32_01605 [Lysinibacillus odysseyi 34hs-1 = NBRC 100172]
MSMKFNGSSKRFPAAKHLTTEEYVQLMETYAAHNRSMGLQMRDKYSVGNIVKIRRGRNRDLLVYYADGECWHYTRELTWY